MTILSERRATPRSKDWLSLLRTIATLSHSENQSIGKVSGISFINDKLTLIDNLLEMGLLDYPQIVKSPMDLATVKSNLLSGKYSTYEQVFDDIQLIWDNCKLYNMIGCEIYKICERMEKTAKRQIQKFRAAHGLPQPASQAP